MPLKLQKFSANHPLSFQVPDAGEFELDDTNIILGFEDENQDELWFTCLIHAVENNDYNRVAETLITFEENNISMIQTFDHPVIAKAQGYRTLNDESPYMKMAKKTIIMVALEYGAHASFELLMEHILKYHPSDCRDFLNATDDNSWHTALDILLCEDERANNISSIEPLKKSITLLINHGANYQHDELIPEACHSGNVELVKFMVEEHGADLNDAHDSTGMSRTNLGVVLHIEDVESYEGFSDDTKSNLKKIMTYLLDKGVDINAAEQEFLHRLILTGSSELFELIQRYKKSIDFSELPEKYITETHCPQYDFHVQKSMCFMTRLLDMPVPADRHETYMKMVIMAGTDTDLLFALNTLHMPRTLPLLTNTDIERIIQNAHDDSADLQKGLIMKVRLLGMPVPIESYDIYLKILLCVGTEEDLAFTLNNFNVTAIIRWLREDANPFQYCQHTQQAKILKAKIDELNLTNVVLQPPDKSIARLFTVFDGNSKPSPRARTYVTQRKDLALGVIFSCILDDGYLSLREACALMQVSLAFHGNIEEVMPRQNFLRHAP